jgi:hypothetical protein
VYKSVPLGVRIKSCGLVPTVTDAIDVNTPVVVFTENA